MLVIILIDKVKIMKKSILCAIVIALAAATGLLYIGCEKHNSLIEAEKNKPQVETLNATGVYANTATIRGNVVSCGRYKITKQGFFYGTDSGFANSNFVSCGSGAGEYETSISNLSPSTTYYFKAYAENRVGFAYGEVASFTTAQDPIAGNENGNGDGGSGDDNNGNGEDNGGDNGNGEDNGGDNEEPVTIPVVQTNPATNVNGTTATLNGSITDNGGAEITDKGFKYGISPSSLDISVSAGNGTGAFATELTGLTVNTTYYYCAYATNSAGTGIGEVKVFATNSICDCGTVTDYDGNVYQTIQIGEQCWMRENLKVSHYKDGVDIPDLIAAYDNDDSIPKYGYLYKSSSIKTESQQDKICPSGWHMPTVEEFRDLRDYLQYHPNYVCGSNSLYITKSMAAKEGWESSSEFCAPGYDMTTNNSSGFNALPVGSADVYDHIDWGYQCNFFVYGIVSGDTRNSIVWIKSNSSEIGGIINDSNRFNLRGSIRCIKD
ncbi:MAG: fibrobacter succinogenes major paralogous domain-containing protein [Bacteroidales bacterium]|nr:fibrobacter succinogenes major paralogous domain-containing protein [Bacteroidales bacterium]